MTPPPIQTNKPSITSFTADRSVVASGETVQLSYAVTNAKQVTLAAEPGGTFATKTELSATVTSPAITGPTTFVLTASNDNGTSTQRVTVTVDAGLVRITAFAAEPSAVAPGGMTTLRWTVAGAQQVKLLRGTDEILSTSTPGNMGEQVVTLGAASQDFTLVAISGANEDRRTINVVVGSEVELRAFAVSPEAFAGASAMISVTWSTANATALALIANGQAVAGFMSGTATGTITVQVTDTTIFVLTAQGVGGPKSATRTVGRAAAETEPNGTIATANAVTGPAVQANISADDLDLFAVTVAAVDRDQHARLPVGRDRRAHRRDLHELRLGHDPDAHQLDGPRGRL